MEGRSENVAVVVFGGVGVVVDDEVLPIGGPGPQRLLGALAIDRDRIVPIDRLIHVCWPDEPPASARRTIHSLVSRLRKAVGDAIRTEQNGYRLALDEEHVDVDRFVATVRAAALSGDAEASLATLDRGLALWRGEPFGRLAAEAGFVGEVNRLNELRIAALEDRAERLIELGRAAEAAAELQSLIAEFPLRERPVALAMTACCRVGRSADALRTYHRHRVVLAAETGLEPSAALRQREALVLRDEPLDAAAEPVPGFTVGRPLGAGPNGVVRSGLELATGRRVALKTVPTALLSRAASVSEYDRRLRIWSQIEHPNVVALVGGGRSADGAWTATDLRTGGPLTARLGPGADPQLSPSDVATIATELAAGLAELHRCGLVHGRIHPGNILFDERGSAALVDLAEAALASASPPNPARDLRDLGVALASALCGAVLDRSEDDLASTLLRHRPDLGLSGAAALLDSSTEPIAWAARLREALGTGEGSGEEGARNPYRGLQVFLERDRADFHGREAIVDEIVARLDDAPFVVVIGPSGSGKSSIVRAGVVPALTRQRPRRAVGPSTSWLVGTLQPGNQPWVELEAALLRVAVNPPTSLLAQLLDGTDGLLRAVLRAVPNQADTRLLLVIDQLEELWTHTDDESERTALLDSLTSAAMGARSPLAVVATLRGDFVDRALEHRGLAEAMQRSSVMVPPMSATELEQAICRPLADVGGSIEPELLVRIAQDVVGAPGYLPMLQFTMRELFECTGGALDLTSYERLGGFAGALADRAERDHQQLDPSDRQAVRRLFRRLITPGDERADTRRRVDVAELDHVPRRLLDGLVGRRLLTMGRDSSGPVVELAHEALIDGWPRLRAWIDEDRETITLLRHLGNAAIAWDRSGRTSDDLWRGRRLDSVAELSNVHGDELTGVERDFIDRGLRLRCDEAAASERQRVRSLVAESATLKRSDPVGALRLALEAHDALGGSIVGSIEGLGALLDGLVACGNLVGDIGPDDGCIDAGFLDDRVVVVREADAISWWDIEERRCLQRLDGLTPGPLDVCDDAILIGVGAELRWLDRADGHTLRRLELGEEPAVVRTAGCGTVAVGCRSGWVLVAAAGEICRLGRFGRTVLDIAIDPDAQRVAATAGTDEHGREWDLGTESERRLELGRLEGFSSSVGPASVDYGPDGTLAALLDGVHLFARGAAGSTYVRMSATGVNVGRVRWIGDHLWVIGQFNGLSSLDADGVVLHEVEAEPNLFDGAISPDERTAVVIRWGGRASIRTLDGRRPITATIPRFDALMARSNRDASLVTASYCGRFNTGRIWSTGETSKPVYIDDEWGYHVFRRDQTEPVAWRSIDRRSATWTDDPRDRTPLPFSNRLWGDIDLTLDGRYALQGVIAGEIEVYDRQSGELATTLSDLGAATAQRGDGNMVNGIDLAPDGRHVAAGSIAGRGAVWEVGTWRRVSPVVDDGIFLVAYRPDGSAILTLSDDGVLAVRHPLTLELEREPVELPSHTARLGQGDGLDITADGRWILASLEAGAQLVHGPTLTPIGEPIPHDPQAWPASLARGANVLVTQSSDHIELWDLDPEAWLAAARRLVGRD